MALKKIPKTGSIKHLKGTLIAFVVEVDGKRREILAENGVVVMARQNKTAVLVLIFAMLLVLLFVNPAVAQQDVTAPVVTELTFEPNVIDTSRSDQTITVTARIMDDLSGMSGAQVSIKHYTGSGWFAIYFFPEDRIQGDAFNGIYQTSFVLKRYSPFGEWVIELVSTWDEVNNNMIFIPASSPGISNPHQLLDPSNETSFINGQWSEIYLPLLGR